MDDELTLEDLDLDRWLSVWITVQFAEDCIHIWNVEYPEDKRPLDAVEEAKAWLKNPSSANADAAANAADAARAAATAVAYAADAAAYAAADVAADVAAFTAAFALKKNKEAYIHDMLKKNLSFVIDYKLKHNQSFGNIGKVFEAATKEDQKKLLFYLDKTE